MKTFEVSFVDSRGELDFNPEVIVHDGSPLEVSKELEQQSLDHYDGDDEFTGILELTGGFYCVTTDEETFSIVGPSTGKWDRLWEIVESGDEDGVYEILDEMGVY